MPNPRNNIHVKRFWLLFIIFGVIYVAITAPGCAGCPYSFTGASIPSHLKTLAIPFAGDRSGSGEPSLGDTFTQDLIQKFIDDNNFAITDRAKADAVLECTITNLSDRIASIAADETADLMRVTISVKVTYRDLVEKKTMYDKSFSQSADYDSAGGLDERTEAIANAIDKLTDDIVLDTVSGW